MPITDVAERQDIAATKPAAIDGSAILPRGADAFKPSGRMATQACIRRIHAQLILSTELEIDTRHLDADGMTDIMFTDRSLDSLPWLCSL